MADMSTTYVGLFHREGRAWVAEARDVPQAHTFGTTLSNTREHLREALAVYLDVPTSAVEIEVQVRFDQPHIDDLLHATVQARRQAERDAQVAADLLRRAATELVAAGLSYRDAGITLGVSHQRIDQLVGDRQAS
jgi:predicted RNase H-like HicB family nuclease